MIYIDIDNTVRDLNAQIAKTFGIIPSFKTWGGVQKDQLGVEHDYMWYVKHMDCLEAPVTNFGEQFRFATHPENNFNISWITATSNYVGVQQWLHKYGMDQRGYPVIFVDKMEDKLRFLKDWQDVLIDDYPFETDKTLVTIDAPYNTHIKSCMRISNTMDIPLQEIIFKLKYSRHRSSIHPSMYKAWNKDIPYEISQSVRESWAKPDYGDDR